MDPRRCKGTLYEGGVHVPMIVTGPAVHLRGTETDALVHFVDLFATFAEIAGVDVGDVIDPRTGAPVVLDGVSWLPHVMDPDLPSSRSVLHTSHFFPSGAGPYDWEQDALRDDRYKVVYGPQRGWWFFEYQSPFDEGPDLLTGGALTPEQDAAYQRLSRELVEKSDGMGYGP
jgi:arylsulfatase A-like enzyme